MVDFFGSLPAPLPLDILETVEDLPSLWNLFQACPAAAAIFEQHYRDILTSALSYYPSELRKLLYAILNHRIEADADINSRHYFAGMWHAAMNGEMLDLAGPEHTIATSFSILAAKSLLSDADRIQQLAYSFLGTHLARTAMIKPSYQVDAYFHYFNSEGPPERRRYDIAELGPPSWVEEQRVLRAFWRLQVFLDLCSKGCGSRGDKIDEDILRLREEGPHMIWGRLPPWVTKELDCVYDYLLDMTRTSRTHPHLWTFPKPDHRLEAVPAISPGSDESLRSWGQDETSLTRRSHGANFFNALKADPHSPLRGRDLKPLWDLGLGFWDLKRMVSLGLMSAPPRIRGQCQSAYKGEGLTRGTTGKGLTRDDMFTRWASIYQNPPTIGKISRPLEYQLNV